MPRRRWTATSATTRRSSPGSSTSCSAPARSAPLIQKVGSSFTPEPKRHPNALHRFGGLTILVADADEAIRKAAHQLLGRLGATVETARDAHEAIGLARQTPYQAAIIDIRLPDLDGYETLCKLREVQPGVPVILMTGFGYDPTHSIVKARQAGVQNVLYKPFRAERLQEVIEVALRPPAPAPPAAIDPPPAPPRSPPP